MCVSDVCRRLLDMYAGRSPAVTQTPIAQSSHEADPVPVAKQQVQRSPPRKSGSVARKQSPSPPPRKPSSVVKQPSRSPARKASLVTQQLSLLTKQLSKSSAQMESSLNKQLPPSPNRNASPRRRSSSSMSVSELKYFLLYLLFLIEVVILYAITASLLQ